MSTAAAPAVFRVVRLGVVLKDDRQFDPLRQRVVADIAFLPMFNAYFARSGRPGSYSYGAWNESARQLEEGLSHPFDWAAKMHDASERYELNVSMSLPVGSRLFHPGEVKVSRSSLYQVPTRSSFLLRHLSGDFGVNGMHDPSPVTSEEEWGAGLLPQARQNDVAIDAANRGSEVPAFVVSRYRLTDEDLPFLDPSIRNRQLAYDRQMRGMIGPDVCVISSIGRRTVIFLDLTA
jgi:hypothetical protein